MCPPFVDVLTVSCFTKSRLVLFVLLCAAGCSRTVNFNDPPPPTTAELKAKLDSSDPNVQVEALVWIGQLGAKAEETKPQLIALLKSPEGRVRQYAAMSLGQIGAAETVPNLISALEDSDPNVQRAAADALGRLGPAASAAAPALEKLIREQSASAASGAPAGCGVGTAQTALNKITK